MSSRRKESKGKALLLFYSKTGRTRKVISVVGEALGDKYDVKLVEVRPKVEIGFFKGASMAKKGETVEIEELKVNPTDYDLIVLGTPVWNGRPPPPINTVIRTISDLSGRRVAVMVTCAFSAGETVGRIVDWVKSNKGKVAGSLIVKTLFGVRKKALEKVKEFSKSL